MNHQSGIKIKRSVDAPWRRFIISLFLCALTHPKKLRSKEFDKYVTMLGNWVKGLDLSWDSSPTRVFSADRSSRNEDVLVRVVKVVDSKGIAMTFTPRATLTSSTCRVVKIFVCIGLEMRYGF